ncbi:heterokaryon incompatibility protein [Diplodia corticola]|uniref:Heterokaryon incompatibility protein n=1 Tax=Diplodia corticola TaxID=236234 RepID=A0A1J9RIA5_9PEZI|nr:heterokaryon incompatibility protein [Diplodia corticola]OJD40376.1 heterokaryon incompatibility protein [Diplodia corticola]
MELVENYSKRRLTYEADKLPALSGVAREMQTMMQDEYLAGLWRKDIVEGLCWSSSPETPASPSRYRAPSWSWASLDTEIEYYFGGDVDGSYLVDFKDAAVALADTNPFGEVRDGWLLLSGHLKAVRLVEGDPKCEGSPPLLEVSDGSIEKLCDVTYAELVVDISSLDGEKVQAHCLPILHTMLCHGVICLLLAPEGTVALPQSSKLLPSPEPNHTVEYQRIGLARFRGVHDKDKFLSWLSASPKQSISIR